MNNSWLDEASDLLHGLAEGLFRVNYMSAASTFEEGHQLACALVVLLDALREDRARNVVRMSLTKSKHPLLAGVFRTLEHKDTGRLTAILDEELGLEFCLGEIFQKDTRLELS